jgi:hypothetical protein
MNFSRFRTSLMVSVFAVASAFAQDPDSAPATLPEPLPEEDIPVEIIPRQNTTFSFGFRRVGNGPKVRFGNLGSVPQTIQVTSSQIVFSDGAISRDALAPTERTAAGAQISLLTPGSAPVDNSTGRSQTSVSNGRIVNVHTTETLASDGTTQQSVVTNRAYTAGYTRQWSVANSSQITAQGVDMSTYGAAASGAESEAQASSGSGFDLQLAYTLGRVGKRFEWGVSAGFSLTDFSASSTGTVTSQLLKDTARYALEAGATTAAVTNPVGGRLTLVTDPDNPASTVSIIRDGSSVDGLDGADQSSTVLLSETPLSEELRDTSNGRTVLVGGHWQLKGAYYTVRLGPVFRFYATEKFALSVNGGFAFTYVGSTFRAREELLGVDVSMPVLVSDENTTQDIVPGYYADLNAEYWMTERTGFYFGFGYQQLGDFQQKRMRGRSAKMDLGNSTGYRFGIITRF